MAAAFPTSSSICLCFLGRRIPDGVPPQTSVSPWGRDVGLNGCPDPQPPAPSLTAPEGLTEPGASPFTFLTLSNSSLQERIYFFLYKFTSNKCS